MIDLPGANLYFKFGRHQAADIWAGYSKGARMGAVESAKRTFSRALGRRLDENLPPYDYGQRLRDDFAVYEQALFLLQQTTQPNAVREADPVVADAVNTERSDNVYDNSLVGIYSPEALRWLGWSGHVAIKG